jgi:DNA modification methylase
MDTNEELEPNLQDAKVPHNDLDERVATGFTSSGIPWTVYCGDANTMLREIDDKAADCMVTSPPYFWQRDYSVDNQIGQERTVEEYVLNIAAVMDEVYRILTPRGVAFLNLGDTYYSGKGESKSKDSKSRKRKFGRRAVDESGGMGIGLMRKSQIGIPWRVAIELLQRKWVLRRAIIWINDSRAPETVGDRPRQTYEYVFMLAKERDYHFDRAALEAFGEEDVWRTTSRTKTPKGIDTAPFPDELVERCLAIGCPAGGVVLEPFAGSGTTLRVALKSNRPAIGIELNPQTYAFLVREISGI